jgi:hypothetical protein
MIFLVRNFINDEEEPIQYYGMRRKSFELNQQQKQMTGSCWNEIVRIIVLIMSIVFEQDVIHCSGKLKIW